MTTAANTSPSGPMSWWKEVPALVGAVALTTGVVVYGLLATAYDKFYAELGLTPADVGMQYGKALGGTAALTILVFMSTASLTFIFDRALNNRRLRDMRQKHRRVVIVIWAVVTGGLFAGAIGIAGLLGATVLLAAAIAFLYGLTRRDPDSGRDPSGIARWTVAVAAAAGVTWLLLSVLLGYYANRQADRIKKGEFVQAPSSGSLVFFSVRGMPTELVTATASRTDAEFTDQRNEHRLLFLGTANGLLVIYDATTQEALMLPATQFRTPVLNCETRRARDYARCK